MTIVLNYEGRIISWSYKDVNDLYRNGMGITQIFDMTTFMNTVGATVLPTSFDAYREVSDWVRQSGRLCSASM
ncbi:MAG: hypothetical protein F9K44_06730 [Hyphomicrobiaceae bacterium]|nr:MAG: hypothetical protein F9K44_06730 [Hyphomicrobiaceae bacterium]